MKTLKYILVATVAALVFSACQAESPALSGITAQSETLRLNYGSKARVPAWPEPWNCTDYEFTYKSANPDIASVDAYGTITTEGLGTTTITASQGSYSATVTVEVYAYTIADLIKDDLSAGLNGLWEFNKGAAMKATVGKDLVPHYPDGEGSLGPISNDGYTEETGFNKIDGAILTKKSALFELTHNLSAPSTYTFMIDAMRPSSTSANKYTTFFNRDLTNSADQYIYWRKDGRFQFGDGDHRPENTSYFSDDKWIRMVMTKDGKEKTMAVYANGGLIQKWTGADPTVAILPEGTWCLLNADNDGDDAPLYYSTIAVWDRSLTEEEVTKLGLI